MKKIYLLITLLFFTLKAESQGLFNEIYPIGDKPDIGYKTSMVSSIEKITFEANPILRMPFFNNIRRKLMNGEDYGSTLYLGFNSRIRMYSNKSLPVKTPSYRIGIGYQAIIRLSETKSKKNQFIAFMFESGHYSNGQSGCAFDKNKIDGTADCNNLYNTITSQTNLSNILNRESGNYSTNFTEILLNYRIIDSLDDNYIPKKEWSIKFGLNRYHNNLLFLLNIGGYTEDDIKIYGKNRFLLGIERRYSLSDDNWFKKRLKLNRASFEANLEYISKPHSSVKPSRLELTATAYLKNNLGFFVSGIFGHDNYNYRFVDSGSQISLGITFDIFPPIEIK